VIESTVDIADMDEQIRERLDDLQTAIVAVAPASATAGCSREPSARSTSSRADRRPIRRRRRSPTQSTPRTPLR